MNRSTPRHNAILINKYSSYRETLYSDAATIVRVAHKEDQNNAKTKTLFAIKIFRGSRQEVNKKYQDRVASEYCITRALRHPNIIHTLDLLQDSRLGLCQVMEYCKKRDLLTRIQMVKHLEAKASDCYFKQLVLREQYIHSMGISHQNLKPENLLLTYQESLKIAYFVYADCFKLVWERESHNCRGLLGTVPYIAPEQFVFQMFNPKAIDIWLLGIIYLAIRTRKWP